MSNSQLNNNAAQTINTSKEDKHMNKTLTITSKNNTTRRDAWHIRRGNEARTLDHLGFDLELVLTKYSGRSIMRRLTHINDCYELMINDSCIIIELPYDSKEQLLEGGFNITSITHLQLIMHYTSPFISCLTQEDTTEIGVRYVEERHLKDLDTDLDIYRLTFYLKDQEEEDTEDEQTVSD